MINKNSRSAYWDSWKGIAIIAVVAIHACSDTSLFSRGSFNWVFGILIRQIFDFAVPIFFAFAGLFSTSSINATTKKFYLKRINRIIIPYVIWTIIYLLIKSTHSSLSLTEVIKSFIFGTGIHIGYFVIVLLQFTLLTSLYNTINKLVSHITIALIGVVLGTAYNYYFSASNPDLTLSKFPFNGLLFVVWYPFYHLGYIVSRFESELKIKNIRLTNLSSSLLFFLVLASVEGFYWALNGNYSFGVSQLKISSFIVSTILFLYIICFKEKTIHLHKDSHLSWLGSYSYFIYLTHLLFLPTIQKTIKPIEWLYGFQPIFILSSSVITIAICILLIKSIKNTLPQSILSPILGK